LNIVETTGQTERRRTRRRRRRRRRRRKEEKERQPVTYLLAPRDTLPY
jgi:hypothetical protein